MDNGKKALTIDEIPLEWCFSDGVILDFTDKKDGASISSSDIEKELKRIQYKLKPFDIVLIMTGTDKYWKSPEYMIKGAGMTRESTLYLIEHGIKVMGIDSWSWDRPLYYQAKEFQETRDPGIIWEAHFAGIEKGFFHMGKMINLDKIPKPFDFKIACFPVKIKGASAGWVRPVAIVE